MHQAIIWTGDGVVDWHIHASHGINVLTMGKNWPTWQSNGAVYSTRLQISFISHPRTATKMITELFIIFQILFIDFIDCYLETFRYSLHMNLTISIPYKTHMLNTHPISQLLPLSFLQMTKRRFVICKKDKGNSSLLSLKTCLYGLEKCAPQGLHAVRCMPR